MDKFQWDEDSVIWAIYQMPKDISIYDLREYLREFKNKKRKEKDIPKPLGPVHWQIVSFKGKYEFYGNDSEMWVSDNGKDFKYYRCTLGKTYDLEILLNDEYHYSVKGGQIAIHSVKDLVRDITFTVGDICTDGKIERFYFSCGYLMIDTDKCTCLSLPYLQKVNPKVPLFTTDKNEPVYYMDKYWVVTDLGFVKEWFCAKMELSGKNPYNKYFLTEKEADEYILLNKPIQISFKELNGIINRPCNIRDYETVDNTVLEIKDFFNSKINP